MLTARAAPPTPATEPEITPYQRNAFLFAGESQAISSLSSPDLLMRRSGVEWLGWWTAVGGGATFPGVDANRARLKGRKDLVPALVRALGEMPEQDSAQASRLLVLIGEPARTAIPALCNCLFRWDGANPIHSGVLRNSLVHLCGGPERLAPTLVPLLNDKQPRVRQAAARGLRFCADPTFVYTFHPDDPYPAMSPDAGKRWRAHFLEAAVPALTRALDDPAPGVSLAAAQSLERITADFEVDLLHRQPQPFWKATVAPLSRLAASSDAALRLAALRVLAFEPGDVSPAAPALRAGLQRSKEEREYALYALAHAARRNPSAVLDVFLADLGARDLQRRRIAADDLQLAAMAVWDGTPGEIASAKWNNDSRLFGHTPDARRNDGPLSWEAAAAHDRLLNALVNVAMSPDREIRTSAVSALEQISGRAVGLRGRLRLMGVVNGRTVPIDEDVVPKVIDALTLASDQLMSVDPELARRLRDRKADFSGPVL